MEQITFRIQGDQYVPYQPTVIEDWERALEDDLEKNPHVLLYPSRLLYIGRQTLTDFNRAIDLLAIDADRRIVVIELKKNNTPRQMVAQALEYAAFIRRQDYDGLNAIAMDYFSKRRQRLPDHAFPSWKSLAEAHQSFFEDVVEPEGHAHFSVNPKEIIILEGQSVSPDIVDVAKYLRAKDIDIRVQQFDYQRDSDDQRLLTVRPLVGSEKTPSDLQETGRSKGTLAERLASSPVANVYRDLVAAIEALGLKRRDMKTSAAFDLNEGGTHIANAWPSPSAPLVYFVIYGSNVSQELQDAYQEWVQSIGVAFNRGTGNLSVRISADTAARIPELVAGFKEIVVSALMAGQ